MRKGDGCIQEERRRRVGNSQGRSTSVGEYKGKPLCWKALVGAGRMPKMGKCQALRGTRVMVSVVGMVVSRPLLTSFCVPTGPTP